VLIIDEHILKLKQRPLQKEKEDPVILRAATYADVIASCFVESNESIDAGDPETVE